MYEETQLNKIQRICVIIFVCMYDCVSIAKKKKHFILLNILF